MEIPKTWQPAEAEAKWYQHWLDQKFFASKPNPDKEAYTIVIPPPNVTGVLHMGHMLNNTIQDVLVRRARMQGKEACWVPGTDHASIATEAKVVAMLKERGIDKRSLSREEFLSYAWEWKEKYGGIILEQLKKMGASCDWDRTRFTMEPSLSDAVIEVFVDLYNKGLIYRGVRMVNWDPAGRTAISDDEVNYKEVQSRLVYITYPIEGEVDSFITIATTRPETIFADVAICVHPEDERYKHLVGKNALIPIINKAIPIIFDTAIDLEFGTGCLKVTPAHDIVDYEIGQRHNLPIIDLLNEDGTLNEHGERYQGQDRFVVRKQIVKDLQELGLIAKIEDIKNNVGFSERTDAVIEPKLSMQWFLKMEEISKPALQAVMDDTIKLHPPKFKNMYSAWMENVRDWCISRQLWWGHQIPAYYLPNGKMVVAQTKAEALLLAQAFDAKYTEADLRQDEDVLDTWFSSWLWPISVFDGFKDPENEDIKFYYPTDTLVTAPEILFFWVARMIIAGYEYRGALPFKDVYLTGIVRDKQGRKMSKSLGNSPDPFELIAKYGADGMRAGMLFSSPAGNDLPFDEKLCEQGRNFSNKIWNAFRLIKGWEVDNNLPQPETNKVAITWFEANFNQALAEIEEQYSKFRISEVLLKIYNLVWDDFCSWYLEMIKPGYEQPIDVVTRDKSLALLEQLIKVLK
jgi:valyl-tRNA synthetase